MSNIHLVDDGTLDTVLHCTDCGEEFRYNYDPENYDNNQEDDSYNSFVLWAIKDATEDHECNS